MKSASATFITESQTSIAVTTAGPCHDRSRIAAPPKTMTHGRATWRTAALTGSRAWTRAESLRGAGIRRIATR